MPVEIRELGPVKTSALGSIVRQRLTTIVDSSFLDDALPEYVLVLLANRHSSTRIEDELASFLGEEQARSFTKWLIQEYEGLRSESAGKSHNNSDVAPERESNSGADKREQQRRRLGTTRMFQTALRDATAVDKQHNMQVDNHTYTTSRSSSKENMRQRSPQRNTTDARDIIRRRRLKRDVEERAVLDRDLDDISQRVVPSEEVKQVSEEGNQSVKPVKCQYWPQCKAGDACPFIHPSEQCRYFPTCSFGDQCLFIHPSQPCRFQDKCANPNCNYQHKSPAQITATAQSVTLIQPALQYGYTTLPAQHVVYKSAAQAAILCRFHPKCINAQCSFLHPSPNPCRYGVACTRPDCIYTHPTGRFGPRSKVNVLCRFGKQCSRVNCPFQHHLIDASTTAGVDASTATLSVTTPEASTGITATKMES